MSATYISAAAILPTHEALSIATSAEQNPDPFTIEIPAAINSIKLDAGWIALQVAMDTFHDNSHLEPTNELWSNVYENAMHCARKGLVQGYALASILSPDKSGIARDSAHVTRDSEPEVLRG